MKYGDEMFNLKRKAAGMAFVLTALLCAGCNTEKENHIVTANGTEWGVKIEVILKGGGSAILVCPKFDNMPLGAHGRECYLDSYDKNGK